MNYLRVRNWERFQHYKDRRPPWIKYHVESLDDYELTALDVPTRLVYSLLLLVAARTDNNIPRDCDYISRQITLGTDVVSIAVETLISAGFLVESERKRDASKALARRKQSAMPRQRRLREEKNARTRANGHEHDPAGALFALRTMIANGAIPDHETLYAEVRARQIDDATARILKTDLDQRLASA